MDNFQSLAGRIGQTIADTIGTDLALLKGYSEAKARSIAHFTLLLGQAYAAGEIAGEAYTRERDELTRMVARFVRNIEALAAISVERIVGRVLGLLDTTIGRIASVAGILAPVPLVI